MNTDKPRFADTQDLDCEVDCPDCSGSGVQRGGDICDTCNGVGRIEIDSEGDYLPAAPPCDCGGERWRDGRCVACGTPIEGQP